MIFRKSKKNELQNENASAEFPGAGEDKNPLKPEAGRSGGYFQRLKDRLSQTRKTFSDGFDKIFTGKKGIDDELLEELEELLITSDIGVQTALALMETLSSSKISEVHQIKSLLKDEILSILKPQTAEPVGPTPSPRVVMVVGVNGTGKTTTIGKLAARATASGKTVLIGAADTFRAAAIEQLIIGA
jgi:fused signal recognition particle receptor